MFDVLAWCVSCRYLWIRMQQVKEQISELSRKQACRPSEPQYGRLYQELQHYLCSIGQPAAVRDLLSHLLKVHFLFLYLDVCKELELEHVPIANKY